MMTLQDTENNYKDAEKVNAFIKGGEKSEAAEVYIIHWTPGQRKLRTLKSFVIWFGLAVVSVFIPIAHFFLVPFFLIISFVAPAAVYAKKSQVLGGTGTCPFCAQVFNVAKASDRWPLQDICDQCHRHVRIEKT